MASFNKKFISIISVFCKHHSLNIILFLLFVFLLAFFPFGRMRDYYLLLPLEGFIVDNGEKRIAYREGQNETIQYLQKDIAGVPYYHRLVTNNHSMSSTNMWARRYMKFYTYLPVAVLPDPHTALLICFGCGITAQSLVDTASLKRIDIVDISKDVIDMSSVIFKDPRKNPLNDPRVTVHIEDGRFYLMTSAQQYHIITAEPPPPKASGVVNLYTQEFFQLIHNRLVDGGMVTYWLPVNELTLSEAKSILKAFCNVFQESSLWLGVGHQWMMVGVKGSPQTVSESYFRRQWNDPVVGKEIRALGFTSPEQLCSYFIADQQRLREWIGTQPPLTDNYPHRLSTERPTRDFDFVEYDKFLDSNASLNSFLSSSSTKRLVPDSFQKNAVRYFPIRNHIVNLTPPNVSALHEAIHNPFLHDFIVWTFGSDMLAQEILSSAKGSSPTTYKDPEILIHLAAGATKRREYKEAADYLYNAARLSTRILSNDYLFEFGIYFARKTNNRELQHAFERSYLQGTPREIERRTKKLDALKQWMDVTLRH